MTLPHTTSALLRAFRAHNGPIEEFAVKEGHAKGRCTGSKPGTACEMTDSVGSNSMPSHCCSLWLLDAVYGHDQAPRRRKSFHALLQDEFAAAAANTKAIITATMILAEIHDGTL
jgi:hypothetical protein